MPKKSIKRGFRTWGRCDDKTGYLYEFDVFTGTGDNMEHEGLGYMLFYKTCQ